MIKVIFWDFDGVLMDSNAVRDVGFEEVLREFPRAQLDELMSFHRSNGGLSRYVKFRYFFEEIRGESITEEALLHWANLFSSIMRKLLMNPTLLIQETLDFVKTNHANYKMHITSGSDQEELRYICNELDIARYFVSIHGSPKPKKEWVKELIALHNYDADACVLVGDSINDFEAAEYNGIFFKAYNGSAELNDKTNIEFEF